MSVVEDRHEADRDIEEALGLVPEFFQRVPDYLLPTEWASFKSLVLSETAIPNKYKEMIGLAVSGATRCRYCAYFDTEAARLFGATEGWPPGAERLRAQCLQGHPRTRDEGGKLLARRSDGEDVVA